MTVVNTLHARPRMRKHGFANVAIDAQPLDNPVRSVRRRS